MHTNSVKNILKAQMCSPAFENHWDLLQHEIANRWQKKHKY